MKFDKLNKRYTCKSPFNDECESLPDNFSTAKNRLLSLQKTLLKDKNLAQTYGSIIDEYLKEGIIERVNNTNHLTEKVHYLPHRPIIKNERDTTKTRIIFDALSKSKGQISLNDSLYPGPCLLPHLYDILLCFRLGKIGIVADIKQAFLQINIDLVHCNYLRFLWFTNID